MRPNNGPRLGVSPAGYYEIRWTENGRSRRESTMTKDGTEAQRALAEWIFRRGESKTDAPTVAMVLSSYLDDKEVGEDARERVVARHLVRLLGERSIDSIGHDDVRGYRRARQTSKPRPASLSTVRRELATLIAAINHALRLRRITPAMVPTIDLPEESAPRTETFTAGQVEVLLELTAPKEGERMSRLHRFIWLASETASRRRAIETLPWAKVSLDYGIIDYRIAGKHKKKRRVMVPVSNRLAPVLKRMQQEAQTELVLDTEDSIYPAWIALMKRAARITGDKSYLDKVPHDLRRTWATLAAKAGISMWDIAGVLGDSLDVVTKHYAHHSPGHLQPAVNFAR